MRINISALIIACLVITACGGGGGGGDTTTPLPGPYQLTFSLDSSFQADHGNQPISIGVVRASDGIVVAGDIGIVSATQNPSFGGTIGVCDPIAIDHQWSVELLSPTNDVDFTVSYQPTLTEDVCSTFP